MYVCFISAFNRKPTVSIIVAFPEIKVFFLFEQLSFFSVTIRTFMVSEF